MTKIKSKPVPDHVLETFQHVTVAELLASPAARCWVMSALDNTVRFADEFEGSDTRDEGMLLMAIFQGIEKLSRRDRYEMFRHVTDVIQKSRRLENS